MIIKNNLDEQELVQAKNLYKEAFNDSDAFIDLYFGSYAKNNKGWFGFENNKLIFMAWLNEKRINFQNEKEKVGLIVAVATKKENQKQGVMKSFFESWLKEISLFYKHIFIQAYNWNVYKKYPFSTCTIKKTYRLRKDQFLKPSEIFKITNYDLINDIYNQFVNYKNIENYTYRTTKENKMILKMFEAAGDKIIHNKKAYVILSSDSTFIIDYAYTDFKEFIRLLSNLKFDTKIYTFLDLDKRYFNILDEVKIETKILNFSEDVSILFNEHF